MSDLIYANGQVSIKLRVFIPDTTSLVGNGKTGLTFSSIGLIISTIADNEATPTNYTQVGGTIETITTLGTFAAPTATKCRFREIDAVNQPGAYELQIADARWAVSGATYIDIYLPPVSGLGTGMYKTRVRLTAVNPQDAVAFGLSRIDAAISSRMATFTLPANFSSLSIDGSGLVNIVQAAADKVWGTTARTLSSAGVQGIWDALTANLTTANSIGKRLVDFVTTLVYSTPPTPPTASENAIAVVDQTLTGHSTAGTVGGALSTSSAPTVSQIVDGVWNELLAGHTTPNSAAQILISAASGGSAPTVSQIVNGILNELLAGHTTPGSVAVAINLINAVYAAAQTIGAGVTYIRNPVSPNADTELRQGVRYTGAYALHYTSDSAADLLASGITVALNFAGESFPASSVVGSAGDWDIYIPITELETAAIVLGTYPAQLALFDGAVELPELSNFNVTMAVNP